jgi:hypothetical protein
MEKSNCPKTSQQLREATTVNFSFNKLNPSFFSQFLITFHFNPQLVMNLKTRNSSRNGSPEYPLSDHYRCFNENTCHHSVVGSVINYGRFFRTALPNSLVK